MFDLIDSDASGFLEEEEGKYFFTVVGCDPAELDYYWADLLRCADANRDRADSSAFAWAACACSAAPSAALRPLTDRRRLLARSTGSRR